MFETDEETGQIKLAEAAEGAPVSTDDFKSLENWSHFPPYILKAGRGTHYVPAGMEEDAAKEYSDKLAEEDPPVERFKSIGEDKAVDGLDHAWVSKVAGDTQQYNKPAGGEGAISYAVNVIKSQRWPGAVTVCKGGNYCNMYVGDAIKRGDTFFSPTEPPEVMGESKDPEEQIEPQGKEAEEQPVAAEGAGEDA